MIRKKELFHEALLNRFPLRFHMSAILIATAFSGVLTSKLLLLLHLNNLIIRYPIAVFLAYLFFFLCIKLWLWYIAPKRKHTDSNISDWIDLPTPNSSGTGGGGLQSIRGGGGKFSGAGASGSFDAHSGAIGEGHVTSILDSGSGAADSASGAVGEAAGALADECFIFAALAAIIITILGSAIYIVSEAHVILSEAAFEGLLAASLIRKTRLINEENWIGSIFKTTWKPFALTLLIAFVVAAMLHSHFPAAKSLSEIIKTRI